MTELEELRLSYVECSRQRNELLAKHRAQAQPLKDEDIMSLWKECCMKVEGSSRELVLTFAHSIMARGGNGN